MYLSELSKKKNKLQQKKIYKNTQKNFIFFIFIKFQNKFLFSQPRGDRRVTIENVSLVASNASCDVIPRL